MKKEIICFSKSENALVLQSLGIEVFVIKNDAQLIEKIKKVLDDSPKIIIVDEVLNKIVLPVKEKYNQEVYPIFLSLPFDSKFNQNLDEMEERVKKAIGINIL